MDYMFQFLRRAHVLMCAAVHNKTLYCASCGGPICSSHKVWHSRSIIIHEECVARSVKRR